MKASVSTGVFDSDLLTPAEVCKWLGFSKWWLYKMRRAGVRNPIPCVPVGRSLRYSKAQVTAWLQARQAA